MAWRKNSQGSGATSMNVPPTGRPRPTWLANELMLKLEMEVLALTSFCELNSRDCSNSRKT